MIDCKELRIGNYLLLNDRMVKVKGVPNLIRVIIKGEEFAVDTERLSPIPLTEELLLSVGFEKSSSLRIIPGAKKRKRVEIFILKTPNTKVIIEPINGNLRLTIGAIYNSLSMVNIKYLHELQNAVFMFDKEFEFLFLKE